MSRKKRDTRLEVLKRICANIPPGLIVFDRDFNRRKVFTLILSQGHHLLCRAKSNAVFYQIPTRPKHPKRGRPRRYGNRVHLPYLAYRDIVVKNKTLSVADKVVRTTEFCRSKSHTTYFHKYSIRYEKRGYASQRSVRVARTEYALV